MISMSRSFGAMLLTKMGEEACSGIRSSRLRWNGTLTWHVPALLTCTRCPLHVTPLHVPILTLYSFLTGTVMIWEVVIAFWNSAITYSIERLLPLFLPFYVVGSCGCRSWFLINSKWNTGWITFKLTQNVYDVRMNDWNKVSQNITEEFSWKLQWPV